MLKGIQLVLLAFTLGFCAWAVQDQWSKAGPLLEHANPAYLALSFAKKALEISQKHNLSQCLISAYEGMARAHAVAREYPFAREFVSKAREQLRAVSLDDEDRKTYSDQIDETERMIPK